MLGIKLASLDRAAVERLILERLEEGRGGWIVTANLEIVRQCTGDSLVRELVNQADLVVPDGTPVVWASRVAGRPLSERVTGSDLIWTLTDRAATCGRSVYLLGGSPTCAERAASKLEESSPGLRVAGWDCPPVGFENSPTELESIEGRLRACRPDIVYVGLGFPKQEQLIARLRQVLPEAWFLGVGVSIDFVAGHVLRAPAWTHNTGVEWLYRMYREPRKLARRYMIHGLPFATRLFAWALVTRFARSGALESYRP